MLGQAVHSVIVPPGGSLGSVTGHFGPEFLDTFQFNGTQREDGSVEFVQMPAAEFQEGSLTQSPIGDSGVQVVLGDLQVEAEMSPAEKAEWLEDIAEKADLGDENSAADGSDWESDLDVEIDDLRAAIVSGLDANDEAAVWEAMSVFADYLASVLDSSGGAAAAKTEQLGQKLDELKAQVEALRAEQRVTVSKEDGDTKTDRSVWGGIL